MRFVDLFAGLGGFNLALSQLGHTCVFACEIDDSLRSTYEKNFGIAAKGDIRRIAPSDVPPHDIICAGFPCQPFSKAGSQKGLKHPGLGTLYRNIIGIIEYHSPKYLILENVPNLENHRAGKTWELLELKLRKQGYTVRVNRFSPHDFGIPQIRDRIYIVGIKNGLADFSWPAKTSSKRVTSIKTILDHRPKKAKRINANVKECLEIWQEFLDQLGAKEEVPGPLWSMEFGATYPFDKVNPIHLPLSKLKQYKGAFGVPLSRATTKREALALLPSYATNVKGHFPAWKKTFIRKNREFYKAHRKWLTKWKDRIRTFPASYQKLEWNCRGERSRKLANYIIQIRPSGVRVKRPTTAPSLVAMTTTQVPIIAWEKRYMTLTECKRLQSMSSLRYLPDSPNKAYEALGNAVNVDVVKRIAKALLPATPKRPGGKK